MDVEAELGPPEVRRFETETTVFRGGRMIACYGYADLSLFCMLLRANENMSTLMEVPILEWDSLIDETPWRGTSEYARPPGIAARVWRFHTASHKDRINLTSLPPFVPCIHPFLQLLWIVSVETVRQAVFFSFVVIVESCFIVTPPPLLPLAPFFLNRLSLPSLPSRTSGCAACVDSPGTATGPVGCCR